MAQDAASKTPLYKTPADEFAARMLRQMRAATPEQVQAALQEQDALAAKGTTLSLMDVLVKQGAVTAETRGNVEKYHDAQQVSVKEQVGVQIGIYKLLRKLGEGGMGTVFLAEDMASKDKAQVALKVLSKRHSGNAEFLKRFHLEAKAASKLKHPNIVGTFTGRDSDSGVEGGIHFYAMEYCEGEPLERLLKRERSLPWQKAVGMAVQVARGLQYAHGQGIIHRDIKPGNIYLTKEGGVKILDMGLSKDIKDAGLAGVTLDGQVLGTPHYVSPEQAQGRKDIDGRADIYSLGATLYHLVAGQPPFDGETPANIIIKHVTEPLPNPQRIKPDLPDGIYHIILRMMAKDPSERYRDCTALLADLEPVSRGELPVTRSAQAAQAAFEAQKKQAAEDARTVRQLIHYGKYAAIVLGVLVVFLVGRSVIRGMLGPSKRDLQNRETIAALRNAGEASVKDRDLKGALDHYNKIIALAESEDTSDTVVREEAERAKQEKEKLAAKLTEAEAARRQKELDEKQKEEESRKLAEEKQRKAEDEKKRAEAARLAEEQQRKDEEARAAEEKRKADEAKLAADQAAEEKTRKDAAAAEAEKRKQEQARVERERRKEENKERDALRTECLKPAEGALAELARFETKMSKGVSYQQFAEALRDNWSHVQTFLDAAELRKLREEIKDPDAQALRSHIQAAGELLFKCQGEWREKREAGKEGDFSLESWTGKLYGEVEDAKASYDKFKKMD